MYGAAIGATIASDGDTHYIDNMAVTKCAHCPPTHECSDADIRHKVCDQVQHKRVAAEWITSHRLETEARNVQERERIRRNGEVYLLAKMARRCTCIHSIAHLLSGGRHTQHRITRTFTVNSETTCSHFLLGPHVVFPPPHKFCYCTC